MTLTVKYVLPLLLINSLSVNSDTSPVAALLQGLFGSPYLFKEQTWKFDPNVSARRSIEFEALNGYRSSKLIERFGLGKDGRMAERQFINESRDKNPDNLLIKLKANLPSTFSFLLGGSFLQSVGRNK